MCSYSSLLNRGLFFFSSSYSKSWADGEMSLWPPTDRWLQRVESVAWIWVRNIVLLLRQSLDDRWDEICECGLSYELSCAVLWVVVDNAAYGIHTHIFTTFSSPGRLAQLVARQIPNLKVRSSILLLVRCFRFLLHTFVSIRRRTTLFTSVITHVTILILRAYCSATH